MWAAVPAPGGCLRLGGLTERSPALAGRKSKAFAAVSAPDKDTKDWVEATSGFFDQDNRPIMLFDGVCSLCNGGVRFVRVNDKTGKKDPAEGVLKNLFRGKEGSSSRGMKFRRMRYDSLQSEVGKKLLRRFGRYTDDISVRMRIFGPKPTGLN